MALADDELRLIDAERRQIRRSTLQRNLGPGALGDDQYVGLALSGGGIRSATFNLGVLQALAEERLLRRLDYLSTVSGGGYIGAWLTAWIQRTSLGEVEDALAGRRAGRGKGGKGETGDDATRTDATRTDATRTDATRVEDSADPRPIAALRQFSNYLTPRLGVLSTDSWTVALIYLRNLILNLLVLLPLMAALLLTPWWVIWARESLRRSISADWSLLVGATAIGGIAFWFFGLNLRHLFTDRRPGYADGRWVAATIVLPLFAATCALSLWMSSNPSRMARGIAPFLAVGAAAHLVLWCVAIVAALSAPQRLRPALSVRDRLALLVAAGLSGAFGGSLVGLVSWVVQSYPFLAVLQTPLLLICLLVTTVVMMGLIGRGISDKTDYIREWSSRIGALLLLAAVLWSGLVLIAAHSLDILTWLERRVEGASLGLAASWLTTTVAGLLAGRSDKTARDEPRSRGLEVLARITPYVFTGGLLVAIAAAVDTWVPRSFAAPRCGSIAELGACVALLLLAWFLSRRIDVNEFSMHSLYRNRLTRAYLGGSNPDRRPNPFSGFDAHDDLPLHSLRNVSLVAEGDVVGPPGLRCYDGPYPLINVALNLTVSDELAWQERKARSFVFAPLESGYRSRYGVTTVDTAEFAGGITLGTAMAISGAAASPNMGYHSATLLAFMMTVFNVRLGWWLGNPRRPERTRARGPSNGLLYLLRELFGRASEDDPYLYLSDGGHFENLGIYELVRRRVRLVIASDATADPCLEFGDLGNAIRKCRIDFGIRIDIDTAPLRRDAQGHASWHGVVGTIHYEDVDTGATPGTLLYIKAGLTGDEPADVRQYARQRAAFPHESTADQWFSESQFESYRALGRHAARAMLEPARGTDGQVDALILRLRRAFHPPAQAEAGSFTKQAEALDRIFGELRSDPDLAFLDPQIYPEWPQLTSLGSARGPIGGALLPSTENEARKGFYICNSMIQLMESVYLDLELGHEATHPDNQGWMNQFRHWAGSAWFRMVWAVCACTYGTRFRDFCAEHLGLGLGQVHSRSVGRPTEATLTRAIERADLNALEADIIRRIGADNPALAESFELVLLELGVHDLLHDVRTLNFHFGFALLLHSRPGEFAGRALYVRVQDHLRGMGLARRAILELLTRNKLDGVYRGAELVGDRGTPVAERDRHRFEVLYRTAERQVDLDRRAQLAQLGDDGTGPATTSSGNDGGNDNVGGNGNEPNERPRPTPAPADRTTDLAARGGVRELRLGLVCYGGVSLAIYMHGVTKELLKLVQASRQFELDPNHNRYAERTSEHAYWQALARIRAVEGVCVRVVIDVVSGTSAGGINGIFLAKAMAQGGQLDALTRMWFDKGSIWKLLGGWLAPVNVLGLALNRPPLSGNRMLAWVFEALEDMDAAAAAAGPGRPSLVPGDQALDLFVTTTDFDGYRRDLALSSPALVSEQRYRNILQFHHPPAPERAGFDPTANHGLAFAARATSSFPGAFPPVQLRDLEALEPPANVDDLTRQLFPAYRLSGADAALQSFVDGGVLDNYPFAPTLETIVDRPATVEVDRRLVYIEPDPGTAAPTATEVSTVRGLWGWATGLGTKPGLLRAVLGSVAGLPRHEPILDDILRVHRFNQRVEVVRNIVRTSHGTVAKTLARAFASKKVAATSLRSGGGLNPHATRADLETLRDVIHDLARRDAGFAYAPYFQLKVEAVVAEFGKAIARICNFPRDSNASYLTRLVVRAWGQHKGYLADATRDVSGGDEGADEDVQRRFLSEFDVGYTRRRIRFVIHALNDMYARIGDDGWPARAELDRAKVALYAEQRHLDELIAGARIGDELILRVRRTFEDGVDVVLRNRQDQRPFQIRADEFATARTGDIDALARELSRVLIDARRDLRLRLFQTFQRICTGWPEPARDLLIVRYLGFPYWDALIYPIVALDDTGELDPIDVVRMSPDDTHLLATGGAKGKLKGVGIAHFAAFFRRSYRQNDYLWGRLDAAERITELLGQSVTMDTVRPAFQAIVAEEKGQLETVPDLIAKLENKLG